MFENPGSFVKSSFNEKQENIINNIVLYFIALFTVWVE